MAERIFLPSLIKPGQKNAFLKQETFHNKCKEPLRRNAIHCICFAWNQQSGQLQRQRPLSIISCNCMSCTAVLDLGGGRAEEGDNEDEEGGEWNGGRGKKFPNVRSARDATGQLERGRHE